MLAFMRRALPWSTSRSSSGGGVAGGGLEASSLPLFSGTENPKGKYEIAATASTMTALSPRAPRTRAVGRCKRGVVRRDIGVRKRGVFCLVPLARVRPRTAQPSVRFRSNVTLEASLHSLFEPRSSLFRLPFSLFLPAGNTGSIGAEERCCSHQDSGLAGTQPTTFRVNCCFPGNCHQRFVLATARTSARLLSTDCGCSG